MPRVHSERGQILPLVALGATALILFVALVIDGGFAFERRREAQNAADFAALAGTRVVALGVTNTALTSADVYNAISSSAAANGATVPGLGTASGSVWVDSNGATLAGPNNYVTSTATAIPSSARGVKVPAARTWRPFLLGLINSGNWTASADAVARTTVGAQPICAFCVIGTSPQFSMQSGQTQLTVNGGAVGSNAGLDAQANPMLQSTGTGAGIAIYGSQSYCNNCYKTITPWPPTTISTPIPDPLAFLADPTLPAGTPHAPVDAKGPGTVVSLSPGTYQGMTVEANATINLAPGTYYLTGDMSIQSNGTLNGSGVTLVFMGPQTSYLPQSNAVINLSAPSPATTPVSAAYPFPGMAIYFARDNKGTLQMQSSSTTLITGTIYAVNAAALLDMQSGTTTTTINSMVVVGSANMQSSSKLTVNYNGSQNVQLPGLPPALVE